MLRKRIEHEVDDSRTSRACPARTLVYKGMLTTPQLREFFLDLQRRARRDRPGAGALPVLHQHVPVVAAGPPVPVRRPQRRDQHGAGQRELDAGPRGAARAPTSSATHLERVFPICTAGARDTARFDECLELLHLGRPVAAPRRADDDPRGVGEPRDHARLEAGLLPVPRLDDGALGRPRVGRLHRRHRDRRGARPQRPAPLALLGHRRRPGGDGLRGRRARHRPERRSSARAGCSPAACSWSTPPRAASSTTRRSSRASPRRAPYEEWLHAGPGPPRRPAAPASSSRPSTPSSCSTSGSFGYTTEELKILLGPDGPDRRRAASARWAPTRRSPCCPTGPACCSTTSPSCSPRSPTRRSTPSARSWSPSMQRRTRPRGQPARAHRRVVPPDRAAHPILDNDELAKLLHINDDGDMPALQALRHRRPLPRGRGRRGPAPGPRATSAPRCRAAIADGAKIIVLSDRHSNAELAPIPSLLLTAAVHHHLIREKTRTKVGLVVEAGDAREVHHMALLLGLRRRRHQPLPGLRDHRGHDRPRASSTASAPTTGRQRNYIKACSKGVLKVMSKMGISTVASYTGAQVFEAIGLGQELVDEYFTGTISRLGGIGLDEIAEEVAAPPPRRLPRPARASGAHRDLGSAASTSGAARASTTCSTPRPCSSSSTPPAPGATTSSRSTPSVVDDQAERLATLRGLFELQDRRAPAGADRRGRAGRRRSSSGSPPAP